MNIPLNQFEQIIDETILKRGLDYFRKGLVEEPEEISAGCFEAIVQGSEPYSVSVTIQNETVTEYSCSCPYDLGPVCKHVVSVIFALQNESLGFKPRTRKKRLEKAGEKSAKPGRKTVSEQVDEILKPLSHEALATFIKELCLGNPDFRRIFIARFASQAKGESRAVYQSQVKAILQSAKGRGGFIEWGRTAAVGRAVMGFLEGAKQNLRSGNFHSAMMISMAVLEEMVKAIQYSDDSDGDIGGCAEEAMEVLYQVSKSEIPEEQRKFLFDYAVSAFKKGLFEGWDWHTGIIALAVELSREPEENDKLIRILESAPRSEYDHERYQELILDVLRKSGREKEADAFMIRNMKNPRIREQSIENAIKKGDLTKATELANEGIKLDRKDKPGLADNWVDWLLKIALKLNDREAIIMHARYLMNKANRDHRQYYGILKTHVDTGQWSSFIDNLIKEVASAGRWSDSGFLAWLCIQEERWKELLNVISHHFSLHGIQEYEPYLKDRYPGELADLYQKGILELMERATGRNHYKEATRFIRRMKKIGEVQKAGELIARLQKTYPQRRALMEELESV